MYYPFACGCPAEYCERYAKPENLLQRQPPQDDDSEDDMSDYEDDDSDEEMAGPTDL